MGKDKKHFDEQLQETRTKHHNKLRYRKRVQQEQEAEKQLKEYNGEPPDDDTIREIL